MRIWKQVTVASMLALAATALGQAAPGSGPSQKLPAPEAFTRQGGPRVLSNPKSHDVSDSTNLTDEGRVFASHGSWRDAAACFQQALVLWPSNTEALYSLAACDRTQGDTSGELSCYRAAVYSDNPADHGFRENNVTRLMELALVLLKTDQRAEALKVYQQGLRCLPTGQGPLPPLFTSPGFADADFRASAYTAMGLYTTFWSDPNGGEADFEGAIATQPTLAAPYFYRGLILKFRPGRTADALAAFSQAEQFGGSAMHPFVDKAMKDGTAEFTEAVKKAGLIGQQ